MTDLGYEPRLLSLISQRQLHTTTTKILNFELLESSFIGIKSIFQKL